MDQIDRTIIAATQEGLPLTPHPYDTIGRTIGLSGDEVMARMGQMLATGAIRRIGIIPNHYQLGFRANGMTVWDVPDEEIDRLGTTIGDLEFVSHCYQRPRHLPHWPYNLFAMVHGKTRNEVLQKADAIAEIMGSTVRSREILLSKEILKKSGFRLLQNSATTLHAPRSSH